MKKLAYGTVMVAATWAGYHTFAERVTPQADAALLGITAVVSLEVVVVMLVFTKHWRTLALGLLYVFLATGLLYLRVSSDGIVHQEPPPPRAFHGVLGDPIWIELIRALYLDAAVLIAVSLNRWAWRNRAAAFPYWRNTAARDPFQMSERLP
jgi:hypothetical protein